MLRQQLVQNTLFLQSIAGKILSIVISIHANQCRSDCAEPGSVLRDWIIEVVPEGLSERERGMDEVTGLQSFVSTQKSALPKQAACTSRGFFQLHPFLGESGQHRT